jgi:hypothetical protein
VAALLIRGDPGPLPGAEGVLATRGARPIAATDEASATNNKIYCNDA